MVLYIRFLKYVAEKWDSIVSKLDDFQLKYWVKLKMYIKNLEAK